MIHIKNAQEITCMKKAGAIVAQTLSALREMVRPGVTTRQIDQKAEELITAEGAIPSFKGYRGYQFASCLSINEEVVHGLPSDRRLQEGDIIGIDIGAFVGGLHADTAATYAVNEVEEKVALLLATSQAALFLGIKEAVKGNQIRHISLVIQKQTEGKGFSVVRDLFGHGIGHNLHEEPLVPNFVTGDDQSPSLLPGMTLAIEPMLNMGDFKIKTKEDGWTVVTQDGQWSAHFEHTILVTDGEPEILTRC